MPSPTQAMCSIPKRLRAWHLRGHGRRIGRVARNTSTAIGSLRPCRSMPKTISRVVARLPSREWPRCGQCSSARSARSRLRSYSTSVAPARCAQAGRRSIAGCARCSQSSARYSSSTPHQAPRPASGPARWWRCPRAASGAWPAWRPAGTRATSMACSSGCSSWARSRTTATNPSRAPHPAPRRHDRGATSARCAGPQRPTDGYAALEQDAKVRPVAGPRKTGWPACA